MKPFDAVTGSLYSVLDFTTKPRCVYCGNEIPIRGQLLATDEYRAVRRKLHRIFRLVPPHYHNQCGEQINEIALFQWDSPYVGNRCIDPNAPWKMIFDQLLSTPTLEKYAESGGLNEESQSF